MTVGSNVERVSTRLSSCPCSAGAGEIAALASRGSSRCQVATRTKLGYRNASDNVARRPGVDANKLELQNEARLSKLGSSA